MDDWQLQKAMVFSNSGSLEVWRGHPETAGSEHLFDIKIPNDGGEHMNNSVPGEEVGRG